MRWIFIAVAAVLVAGPVAAAPSARAVVEAKFAAVNRHAIPDIAALYAPDAVITASDFCQPRIGRAGVEQTYGAIFKAIPDATVEVQEVIAEGDRVAVRFVVRSRAAEFAIPIQDFFTVKDGLIVRDEGRFDNGGRPCTP